MASKTKRVGTLTSETRARLLDVTEQIMMADGYAAVTSRRVATDAGVTAALVHYYFGTLDDLFLAVLRRRADQQLARLRRVLETSDRPLRALWDVTKDPARTGLTLEFTLLANHRKVVRSELGVYAEQFRQMQVDTLQKHIKRATKGQQPSIPPVVLLVLINAIGTSHVLEDSIGVSLGHAETNKLVERYLDELDERGRA